MSEWLTVKEAANETRMGYTTFLAKIKAGEIKASRLAHKLLISRADLQEWFKRRETPTKSA